MLFARIDTVAAVSDQRLTNVLALYEPKGLVERIAGDVSSTASDWLERAAEELPGAAALIDLKQWRLAFNSADDIYRHAAESLVLRRGYRVTSARGAHEAVFVVADAILDPGREFDASIAELARRRRHSLEYVSSDEPSDVDEGDARWMADVARQAVASVRRCL